MSGRMLCRCVARLRHLSPGVWKDYLRVKHLHKAQGPAETESDKEAREVLSQHQEITSPRGNIRLYNPSSYHRSQQDSGGSVSKAAESDENEFRKQSNRYRGSSSRYFSNVNNKGSKATTQSPPRDPYRDPLPPDVTAEPRAFQRCRPEYASLTLDRDRQLPPDRSKDAFLLLQKVTLLKGSMEPADISQILGELSHLHPDQIPQVRNDARFIMLMRYSMENLQRFTHAQLLEVLWSFVCLGIPFNHSMLKHYENELVHRAGQMSFHQLLLAADVWRCLGRKVPRYLECLYKSVSLYIGQIGEAELVQLLYVMGEGRRCPTELVHPIEQLLMRHLDHLYPEEVGVVCLGLFKSQTSLSGSVVNCIIDKARSVVEEMSDFAMVNVLKLLRFSYLDHLPWLEAMAQEVPRRAPGMGIQGLMHVALACSALHYRNDRILLALAERLLSQVPHCRTKDSAKLLWAFGNLGVHDSQCPDLYPSLIEAGRRRRAEYERFPEHLLTSLLGLAFVSKFPEDLLALALSPTFVRLAETHTQLELKKDLFTLDETVALELPHWTGPRLSGEVGKEVAKRLWEYAQSTVCQKPEVLEAETVLQDLLGGKEFVRKRMILPHTRSIDLEVYLNHAGQPIPCDVTSFQESSLSTDPSLKACDMLNTRVTLTDDLLAQLTNGKNTTTTSLTSPPALQQLDRTDGHLGTLTKPESQSHGPRDSHKAMVKLAIQVSNRSHYCYRSPQLLGLHALKRRQLQLVGYRVVELYHWEWFPLLKMDRAERLDYMHSKIFSSLD